MSQSLQHCKIAAAFPPFFFFPIMGLLAVLRKRDLVPHYPWKNKSYLTPSFFQRKLPTTYQIAGVLQKGLSNKSPHFPSVASSCANFHFLSGGLFSLSSTSFSRAPELLKSCSGVADRKAQNALLCWLCSMDLFILPFKRWLWSHSYLNNSVYSCCLLLLYCWSIFLVLKGPVLVDNKYMKCSDMWSTSWRKD